MLPFLRTLFIILTGSFTMLTSAQEIVPIPITVNDESIQWDTEERQYHSAIWDTEVVTNVAKPTMQVFRPDGPYNSGTSVVICPGGGLYAHSINSEGNDVAEWLSKRGVTAFVLKYRLVPTGADGTADLNTDGNQVLPKAKKVLPLSVADAHEAIKHIRNNSHIYNIDPQRIGIMGFSAGGAVTMQAWASGNGENAPDFIAPIYAWMDIVDNYEVKTGAVPAFIACATDDPLGLASASVRIYKEWNEAGNSAELHMYAKGGHGFGMRQQNLPSDQWIVHFGSWLVGQGLLKQWAE